MTFLRELIDSLRAQLGRRVVLEFRMDAAFLQRGIFPLVTARDCRWAIKVGYIGAGCRSSDWPRSALSGTRWPLA